jgi:hypothetical protein
MKLNTGDLVGSTVTVKVEMFDIIVSFHDEGVSVEAYEGDTLVIDTWKLYTELEDESAEFRMGLSAGSH